MNLKDDAYDVQPGRTIRVCAPIVQGIAVCWQGILDRQLEHEYLLYVLQGLTVCKQVERRRW